HRALDRHDRGGALVGHRDAVVACALVRAGLLAERPVGHQCEDLVGTGRVLVPLAELHAFSSFGVVDAPSPLSSARRASISSWPASASSSANWESRLEE